MLSKLATQSFNILRLIARNPNFLRPSGHLPKFEGHLADENHMSLPVNDGDGKDDGDDKDDDDDMVEYLSSSPAIAQARGTLGASGHPGFGDYHDGDGEMIIIMVTITMLMVMRICSMTRKVPQIPNANLPQLEKQSDGEDQKQPVLPGEKLPDCWSVSPNGVDDDQHSAVTSSIVALQWPRRCHLFEAGQSVRRLLWQCWR